MQPRQCSCCERNDLLLQRRGRAFVGIQAEHVVVFCLLDRKLFLLSVPRERRVVDHARAQLSRNLARAILAPAVNHHNFIAERERPHAVADAILFLIRDHATRHASMRLHSARIKNGLNNHASPKQATA